MSGLDPELHALADGWMKAIGEARIAADLERIYALCTNEIRLRGPSCWASGRCCNFDRAEHRLYVTGIEAAYCVSRVNLTDLSCAKQQADPERIQLTIGGASSPTVATEDFGLELARAIDNGGCPFQVANLCGVHEIKPLGCRVYFCDRSAQGWQRELSQALLAQIRRMHERYDIEYRYGEWRTMLGMFRT